MIVKFRKKTDSGRKEQAPPSSIRKWNGKRAPIESAVSKLFISESYVENCMEALQIHGAYGYSKEFDLEKNLRDSIAGKIYSGTSEIQRNIIASFLGL